MKHPGHPRLRATRIANFTLALVISLSCLASLGLLPQGRSLAADPPSTISQAKSWDFERFDTDIKVSTDGSLLVRETQVANFTGSFSFFNRDLKSTEPAFTVGRSYGRVRYSDIRVLDLSGQPESTVNVEKSGGDTRVHIEFNATNEQRGWVVEYRVTGAIIYTPDYDRLYWNTVSTNRDVSIKTSRATVTLPEATDMTKVRTRTYVDTASPPASSVSGREGDTLVWKSTDIKPQTNVTIDVAFPRGIVAVPLTYRASFGAAMIALAALLGFGVLILMLALWWKKGRDKATPALDVVRYEPPGDLRPMGVAFLVNETTTSSDITAAIVDLAIRGHIVITEQESGTIMKHKLFGFERQLKPASDLDPYEAEIMDGLFESGTSISEEDLKDKFYTHVPVIDSKLKEQVLGKGLFDGDPGKTKRHYHVIGLLLLVLIVPLIYSSRWIDLGYLYAFVGGLAIAGVSVFVVGTYMSRRTAKGSEALSYVKGFKEYMATAEKEEMKFMTPENFQANLPYAMVLGVAKQWSGKFADIYTTQPDWYRSSYPGAAFSTVYLSDSLSQMQTSVASTLTSSPSSSSSGGGGGFGGGSSGGGFGGGGSSAG